MKSFGKGFSEYLSFEEGFLILVLVVGLARLRTPMLADLWAGGSC